MTTIGKVEKVSISNRIWDVFYAYVSPNGDFDMTLVDGQALSFEEILMKQDWPPTANLLTEDGVFLEARVEMMKLMFTPDGVKYMVSGRVVK